MKPHIEAPLKPCWWTVCERAIFPELVLDFIHENSLDVILSVSGRPVMTLELKNPLTGGGFVAFQLPAQVQRGFRLNMDFAGQTHLFSTKRGSSRNGDGTATALPGEIGKSDADSVVLALP